MLLFRDGTKRFFASGISTRELALITILTVMTAALLLQTSES